MRTIKDWKDYDWDEIDYADAQEVRHILDPVHITTADCEIIQGRLPHNHFLVYKPTFFVSRPMSIREARFHKDHDYPVAIYKIRRSMDPLVLKDILGKGDKKCHT